MQKHLLFRPLGETYKLTISNTATPLPTIPAGALKCHIQVETAEIRAKFNATDSVTYSVTAGVGGGFLLPINTVANPYYTIAGMDNMSRLRLFRNTGTDAFVNVLFLGETPEQPSYDGGLA